MILFVSYPKAAEKRDGKPEPAVVSPKNRKDPPAKAVAASKKSKTSDSDYEQGEDDDDEDEVFDDTDYMPERAAREEQEAVDLVDTDEDAANDDDEEYVDNENGKNEEDEEENEDEDEEAQNGTATATINLDFISDEAARTTERKLYDNDLFWDLIEPVEGVTDYAYIRFEHTRKKNHPSYASAALYYSNKQSDWRLHPKFHIQPNEECMDRYIDNKKVTYGVTRSNGDALTQRMFLVRMPKFCSFSDEQITRLGDLIVDHLKNNPKLYSKSIGQEGDYIRRGLSHCDLVGEFEALQACKANHQHELNATWGRRNPDKLKAYFKKGQLPSAFAHELGAPRDWTK